MSIGDIDFPRANGGAVGQPQILTFTFSPHSFTSGDWFRFSGDVDPIPSAGGGFGELGATFSVNMSSGETLEVPFSTQLLPYSQTIAIGHTENDLL